MTPLSWALRLYLGLILAGWLWYQALPPVIVEPDFRATLIITKADCLFAHGPYKWPSKYRGE